MFHSGEAPWNLDVSPGDHGAITFQGECPRVAVGHSPAGKWAALTAAAPGSLGESSVKLSWELLVLANQVIYFLFNANAVYSGD